MEITCKHFKKITLLIIEGKFNIDFIDKFDDTFYSIIKEKPEALAIDLYNIDYIDSSALGSLIKAMNSAKQSGTTFYLYNLKSNILAVFKLSYLDKFFNLVNQSEMANLYPEVKHFQK